MTHHRIFQEKTLLIASNNQGKINEFRELLVEKNIKVVSAKDFQLQEPEETGTTYKENAIIKAKYYSKATNLPALADDSGINVEMIGNQPGVYSARWAGKNKDFQLARNKIKALLTKNNLQSSKASFTCHLTLYWLDGHMENFSGEVEGIVNFPEKGQNGFGYDSIFIPNGYEKTFAELTSEEKNKISPRFIALQKILNNCFC